MNNIIIPPVDKSMPKNYQPLIYEGLKQSLRKHRNIFYIHNRDLNFAIGNQLKEVKYHLVKWNHVSKTLMNQYYFKQDNSDIGIIHAMNHGLYPQAEDITRVFKYPHLLFKHQPFFFQMNTSDDECPTNHIFHRISYKVYLVYIINQIMYYIRKHPKVNKNGLDVIIFSLYRIPLIPRICLYLRDAKKYSVRFLIGTTRRIQSPYSMEDGYSKDGIDNADTMIFDDCKEYYLMCINAKESHQPIPKLSQIW